MSKLSMCRVWSAEIIEELGGKSAMMPLGGKSAMMPLMDELGWL